MRSGFPGFLVLATGGLFACSTPNSPPESVPPLTAETRSRISTLPAVGSTPNPVTPSSPPASTAPPPTQPKLSEQANKLLEMHGDPAQDEKRLGHSKLALARHAWQANELTAARRLAEEAFARGATGEALIIAGLAALGQKDEVAAADRFAAGLGQLGQLGFLPKAWPFLETRYIFPEWRNRNELLLEDTIISTRTGLPRAVYQPPQGCCDSWHAGISPNGNLVACGCSDSSLHVYDDWRGTWSRFSSLTYGLYLEFSPDGRWLSVAGTDKVVVHQTRNYEVVAEFPALVQESSQGTICLPTFSDDSRSILVPSDSAKLSVFGLDPMKPLGVIEASCDQARLTKTSVLVASANQLRRFPRQAGKIGKPTILDANRLLPLPEGKWGYLSRALSPNLDKWLIATMEGHMALIDLGRRKADWVRGSETDPYQADNATFAGDQLALVNGDELSYVSLKTGNRERAPNPAIPSAPLRHPVAIGGDLWSLDDNNQVWHWALGDGSRKPDLRHLKSNPLPNHPSDRLLRSNDGRFLAQIAKNEIRVWDPRSQVLVFKKVSTRLLHGLFFYDGASPTVGVCSRKNQSEDPKPEAWDVATGNPVKLPLETSCYQLLHASETTVVIHGRSGRDLAVYDRMGKLRFELEDQQMNGTLALSPNGKYLVYQRGARLRVLETAKGKELSVLEVAGTNAQLTQQAFDAEGHLFFTAGSRIYRFDPRSQGQPKVVVDGPKSGLGSAFPFGVERVMAYGQNQWCVFSVADGRNLGCLAMRKTSGDSASRNVVGELWHPDGTVTLLGGELPDQIMCAVGPYRFPLDACRWQIVSERGLDSASAR